LNSATKLDKKGVGFFSQKTEKEKADPFFICYTTKNLWIKIE